MMLVPPRYDGPVIADPPPTFFLAGGVASGRPEVRYPVVQSSTPFDRVVLSPNGTIGAEGSVEFRAGQTAADAVPLVEWAGPLAAVEEGNAFPPPVDVDVLALVTPVRELTIVARRTAGDHTTNIIRLGVTRYDSRMPVQPGGADSPAQLAGFSPVTLPVGFLSQFAAGAADDDSRCCPTSAAMLLRFWGIDIDPQQFARLSYDRRHRVHGNWSLTVAVISSFGMVSWVQRHDSLLELYQTVRAGRPVIVSISFRPGELPAAPVAESAGHLVVVRGFAANGDVLVNDPAGRTADTGQIAYDRASFSRAWLGHGGIALHAAPEEATG